MPARLTLNRFPEILVELEARAQAEVARTANAVAQEAKERVPVDTGRLRDSIHGEPRGRHSYAVVADATSDWRRSGAPHSGSRRRSPTSDFAFPYGIVVEFGSRYQSGQPFLIPSLESQSVEFVAGMKGALASL